MAGRARPRRGPRHGGGALRVVALAAGACAWALSGPPAPAAAGPRGAAPAVRVALTRERGQNDKLRRLLEERLADVDGRLLELVELPCIEHGPGADREAFEERLAALAAGAQPFDAVALTSPEAARVFLAAWTRAADLGAVAPLPARLACVGKGTAKVVEAAGLQPDFQPSLANAETLAAELPEDFGRVLYPASALAQSTLQEGLEARGFAVERLNTYTTQAVQEFSEEDQRLMASAAVATFGSPSAVKAWARHCSGQPIAACIGGTSKKAAEAAGFRRVAAPEKPGLDGWAEVTAAAAREALAEVAPAPAI